MYNTQLVIDAVGIIVGLVSIYLIWGVAKRHVAGRVGTGLDLFVWGLITMTASFVWLFITPPNLAVVHHVLMTLGMIFFVASAWKFSSLLKS